MVLKIASRGSTLALWQAEHVKARLEAEHGDLRVQIAIQHTTGDRITDVPLARIGDKGLFTKEVDRAVLDGAADLAVHSLKDVPTVLEAGLDLGAITRREDPRDAVVFGPGPVSSLDDLPPGARVGTSSLRRRAQLLDRRPDVIVEDLRGNLDTRLRRVAEGDFDAAILALAGIRRLGREEAVGQVLDAPGWLSAVGQGALAIAIRADADSTRALVAVLDHAETRTAVTAERAFLNELEGGCQVPIGAVARVQDQTLTLHGLVASLDGHDVVRGELSGSSTDPEGVGRALARRLADAGATEILDAIRGDGPDRAAVPAP
ncbi:MAG: hydroxymethylbilane synthase [Gemmatimonadota bacterium]|jgi:hydroxymethylbilane synthase